MAKFAFTDQGDGYYEVEAENAASLPDWTKALTLTEPLAPAATQPPTALQQIRSIESKLEVSDAFVRATRQLLLKIWFDRARANPGAATFTDAQVEAWCRANDKTYKALAEAEDAIKPLRGRV